MFYNSSLMTRDKETQPSRIILSGPPGSGKTRRLIEYFNDARIHGNEDRMLFIVPDSSAREHLRDIIARNSPPNVPVSFSDKGIHSLQSLIGSLAQRASASESHLRALIDKWIDTGQLNPDLHPILKSSGGKRKLAKSVWTLRSHGETYENLKKLPPSAIDKDSPLLQGISLWESWLAETGKSDEQDVIEKAIAEIGSNAWDMVLIDGFTEIKPLQWKLIGKLIDGIDNVAIAIDPEQYPSHELYDKFISLGFVEHKLESGCRWENCEDLRWLVDVGLWEIHACRPDSCPEKPSVEHLKIIRAANPAIEASQLAREVARCIEKGYEYSDMAILAPSLASISHVIGPEFSRHGIPIRFFINLPIVNTAPGIFVVQVLSLIIGDWDDEKVCELLSNPISGIPDKDAAKAIKFTCSKCRLGSPDAWLNWAKANTSGITFEFLEKIHGLRSTKKVDPVKFANEIISISAPAIRKTWKDFPDSLIGSEGWALRAVESCLLNSSLVFTEIFPTSTPLKIAAFLKSELESAKGKPLDRRSNCVNAVTLLGSRTWGVKVAMVCGLSRNYFPHDPSRNPFLPDRLRIALDPPLPKYDELKKREEALFRIAVTRASDKLILSWSDEDQSGSPQLPSGPVQKCVEWILDGKMPDPVEHDPPKSLNDAVFGTDIASLALENHVEDAGLFSAIEKKTGLSVADAVRDAQYDKPFISEAKELVTALTGTPYRPVSPTDLNHLSQCPYRFFAKRVLGLSNPNRDEVQKGFDHLKWGTIAHNALSEWFRNGKTDDFEILVRNAVKKRSEITNDSLTEARIEQIVDALNRFAEFEENFWPEGFVQTESELVFDAPESWSRKNTEKGHDPVEIPIDDELKLYLGGRIDRLDAKEGKVAMVVDYKRSGGVNKKQLLAGIDLQLACYIELVKRGLGFDVAIACFLPLKRIDESKSGSVISDPDLIPATAKGFFKTDDKLNVDEYLGAARERISQLVRNLSTGHITPFPTEHDKCGRSCDYHDLCRFRFSGDDDSDGSGGED